MNESAKLPLKVVPALSRDFYQPENHGGPKKQFQEVTQEFRQQLAAQVDSIREHFQDAFDSFPNVPAVARVRVRQDAIAKSHRPTALFTAQTCPIIGAQGLGRLLVSATAAGLETLARRINTDITKQGIANLSTLESLEFYAAPLEAPENLKAKIKLFRHHQSRFDNAIDDAFQRLVRELSMKSAEEVSYSPGLKIYRVEAASLQSLEIIAAYIGTQSVGPFPLYHPVRSTAIPIRAAAGHDFPAPDPTQTYPVVGIVDSGTAELDPFLSPWRAAREVYVAPSEQDNSHGSFVAGLIVHARRLNHGDQAFPSCAARFVDIVALAKDGTTEDQLLATLEDALKKHPEVKVWNLSLGTSRPVDTHGFSDLAAALDRLQRDNGVTFVLAAGNYRSPPFRGWPPEDLGENDRICAPADSLRAIVVGAVAHRDHNASRVKAGSPAPYSRRGPGPLYLPKPELSHIGGNCDASGGCNQIGILSIDGKGNLAEDLGTSFATPLVTTLYAGIGHRILGGASALLNRALLVHAAALDSEKIDPTLLRYRGFGVPPDVETILACDPWQCTLIFELDIAPSVAYEKAIFPMPKSVYVNANTVRADILMTLVHDPDMDPSCGSEYCRSNIEVSLGTYDIGTDGKRHQRKQVPEDPQLIGKGYERDLVEYGFKWSPVKVYRRNMVRGVQGQDWRLDLSVQHRSLHVPTGAQRAALIITIADPAKRAPVYDEMVVAINSLGWAANDLQIRGRLRN